MLILGRRQYEKEKDKMSGGSWMSFLNLIFLLFLNLKLNFNFQIVSFSKYTLF